MKLYRNAIILVVALALLVGAYVILSRNKNVNNSASTTTVETTKEIPVLNVDSTKVTELMIQNKNGTFDFVKKNDSWDYPAAPKGFKLSSENVETINSSIASFNADKVIDENATNLSLYGLDKPVTVTIKTKDGTAAVVQVGSLTSTGDGYYLKLKDSNKVYVVGTYICDSLDFTLTDMTDTTLFTSNTDDINSFSIQKKGQLQIVIKKNSEKAWKLIAPVEADIDSDMMVTILTGITQSTVIKFAENNATDLEKYGLKDALYTLEVGTAKGTTKMLIGKEDKANGVYFARLDGSNNVFTIDTNNYTYIDKPLKEYIVPLVFIQDINKISKVVVQMDGNTTVCDVNSDKNNLTKEDFRVNGKDANATDQNDDAIFKKYYQALIGITFDSIEMGANPVGKPDITITYTLKDKGTVKIEYVSKDSDYFYAMKDGKYTNFIVLKKQLDDPEGIRAMYKKLMSVVK